MLHDAQLHQARALALTKRWLPRRDDYLAEFRANHPDAPPAVGDVVAAGFGGSLYVHWPHIRLVLESARLTVVHNRRLLGRSAREVSGARHLTPSRWASPIRSTPPRSPERRRARSARAHGIPADAMVLAAFGGMTPEKRIGPLAARAERAGRPRIRRLHLMLVGGAVDHYDVVQDAARWAIGDRVHVTGYVPDADLPDYLLAADLCACLRWPTNRETSASWLRCLAAGRATLVSDLADLGGRPDARSARLGAARHVADAAPAGRRQHRRRGRSRTRCALALDRLLIDDALRARAE